MDTEPHRVPSEAAELQRGIDWIVVVGILVAIAFTVVSTWADGLAKSVPATSQLPPTATAAAVGTQAQP